MLPATGFFKNIDCPYYDSSCKRPYCHFRHRKKSQEPTEATPAAAAEVPTYKPTPKSQLANARNHIPISYVPDLAVRPDRASFRPLPPYSLGGDKPTYKPTPLSVLSTGKAKAADDKPAPKQSDSDKSDCNDASDINFDDLETEFNMIDDVMKDAGLTESEQDKKQVDETEGTQRDANPKLIESVKGKNCSNGDKGHELNANNSDKYNGKINHSKSSSSKSSGKSKSESHKCSTHKSESKHRKDHKHSESNKKDKKRSDSKCDDKKKHSKSDRSKTETKDKKHETKSKHDSKRKDSSESRERHRHKSKMKVVQDKDKKDGEKKKRESSDNDKVSVETDLSDQERNYYSNHDMDSQTYMDDSDLEENTLEECYKIFTEYKPTEPQICPNLIKQSQAESNLGEDNTFSFGKKRVAHQNASQSNTKVLFNKPKQVPSAAQVMMNRLKAARAAHSSNEQNNIAKEVDKYTFLKRPSSDIPSEDNKKLQKKVHHSLSVPKPSTSVSLVDDIISGKSTKPRRIAPVQNVYSIQKEKAKIEEMAKMRTVSAVAKTTSQTLIKGAKRIAHVSETTPFVDVPDVLEMEHSKLPVNVRSRYLTMIVEECSKLYFSKEEAQQRAQAEEYRCYERCSALTTYRNSAMLAINRLRKQLQEREAAGLGPVLPGEALDAAKSSVCETQGRKFYENIKRYILTDDELVLHGFPREGSAPGHAVIKPQRSAPKGYLLENDRVCCRCSKVYKVDDKGFALYDEECLYHPLKKRTLRGESIYLCCKSSEETGCATSATHVCEVINSGDSEVEGYQTTMPPEFEGDSRSFEVFALDCEMCYTTKGLELTRVTVVNSECKTVYESLVKPLNSIVDYNTRFSGITEEQMNRTATSILQVQANILHLCNSNTILIGHSLESDMKALKIIHSTIIDTSVLFPHKFGLPHKRALRDLAREYLKKIIQNDISGHDSAEDALTCMELVQWKLKEELKARGVKT